MGCGTWEAHMFEDGVANGTNVYQWGATCTASGLGDTVNWNGYFYNGGGPPNYGMQFGCDYKICLGIGPATYCYGHGMRRWIDDLGVSSTFYDW